jgi:hypothetical protein
MDSTKATFEGIRKNIIEYLSANPTFKDYNFTAPAISTLIDALAYTSHYLMRYANFSVNECFLDSAQLRNNVVSHAKELGYVPHQWSAAKAKIRITPKDSTAYLDGVVIPENTIFTATNYESMKSYTFRTINQHFFESDEKGNWFADVDVVEGSFVTEKFKQDEYYTTRYFLINENVDTEYMSVHVYESESDREGEQYFNAKDVDSLGSDEPLYYIYESYNGKIEVCFGDGKLSKKLEPYSVIKVKYLVTNGSAANNIKSFVLSQNISTFTASDFSLDVLVPSESGGERESIESIRFNAPKYFQAQDRAVTTSDYNVLLLNKFGSIIDSVVTWGGEEEVVPQYGSVFLCIRPRSTETLSPTQKDTIIKYLKTKNLPCVDIQIVDPTYIDVDILLSVDWNKYKTSRDKSALLSLISTKTKELFKMYTTSFKSKFKYSKYLTEISNIDNSIDSILVDYVLRQYLIPEKLDMKLDYFFEFHNEIKKGSVYVGSWVENISWKCSIRDLDEDGVLWLIKTDGTITNKTKIGEVDYNNGTVSIQGYSFSKVYKQLPVECKPVLDNLNVVRRHLLRLSNLSIDIQES